VHREINAVSSGNDMKHVNTNCQQNIQFWNVNPVGLGVKKEYQQDATI